MSTTASRDRAYLEVHFVPNVELISNVRRFVSSFYEDMLGDRDAASRVALATHELLENAVRYSVDGETRARVEIIAGPPRCVTVRTWTRAEPGHAKRLAQELHEMNAESDPFVWYQKVMRKRAKERDRSGLGLARVRAEAANSLTHSTEGEFCIVEARFDLPPPGEETQS